MQSEFIGICVGYCALFLSIYFSHFENKYRIKFLQLLNIHEFQNNRNVNLFNSNSAVGNSNNNQMQHLRLGEKSLAKLISPSKTEMWPNQTGPDQTKPIHIRVIWLFHPPYLIWWTVKLCNSVTWFSKISQIISGGLFCYDAIHLMVGFAFAIQMWLA